MVFAGERYYNIYRVLLTPLGLWPYQESILFRTTFVLSAFTSFTVFQLTTFLTRTCDFAFIMREISYILPNVIYLCLYNLFYFKGAIIKRLFERIKADWNEMEGNFEIKILEKYARQNRNLTLFLIVSIVCILLCLIFIECLPVMLDVVVPLNESRPRRLQVTFELFIDENRYFYVYLIHEVVVVMVAFVTLIATGMLLLAYLRHCCATYKIASDLIENAVIKDTLRITVHRKVDVMCERISRAVCMHRKSMEFLRLLMDATNTWFFVIMIFGVLSLSCNLLRFLNATTLLKETSEIIICLIVLLMHFIAMFVSNLIGQSVIDHSAEIFHAAYRTMWYLAPLHTQKLLLFIMQHSLKANSVFIGGLFVVSLEGFSTLITTSISYFTVIYNME